MTDKATHTPLPCPRCGNRAFVAHGNAPDVNGYAIWCLTDSCLKLPPRSTEAEALTAWNTRAVNSHHDLVEALRLYVTICGNTAYSVDRELAQMAYAKATAILTKEAGHG